MNLIEYDNNKLIDFYMECGIEFAEDKGYLSDKVNSYALFDDDNNFIGAVSFSIYKGLKYIEAVAVKESFRNKGYGRYLLDFAINELGTPIYLVSKTHDFFLHYGFVLDNTTDLLDQNCKRCEFYNVTCFPKVMVYKK